jgi:DNA transformation protein and related proteins
MATKQVTIDFLLEQMRGAGVMRAKKMFGEYGVYCDEKIVALVCDDQLFVKPTEAGENFIDNLVEGIPYPGAKPYFLIGRAQCDDAEWLSHLIRISAAALPSPKNSAKHKK